MSLDRVLGVAIRDEGLPEMFGLLVLSWQYELMASTLLLSVWTTAIYWAMG